MVSGGETGPSAVTIPCTSTTSEKRPRIAVRLHFTKLPEAAGTSHNICSEVVKHASNTSNLFKVKVYTIIPEVFALLIFARLIFSVIYYLWLQDAAKKGVVCK